MELFEKKRSFIAYVTGTILVSVCIYLSREKSENFVGLLTVWVTIMGTYLTKNYFQSKVKKTEEIKKELK